MGQAFLEKCRDLNRQEFREFPRLEKLTCRAPRGAVLLAAESAAQEAGTHRTWYRVLGRYG